MSIRRRGRFLPRTLGVFCLAVGMLMAGGVALGETAPATRPTSAPTLAQIDWRKGFTLHQPQKYAVLVQTRLRRPADLWPRSISTARGILTVTLTGRKEDGSGLFTCQVQVVDGMTGGKSIPPPPASRFSFSTSPAGQPLIDLQALQRALAPSGHLEDPTKMALLISPGIVLVCYPLPPASAARGGDALRWKAKPFTDSPSLHWRAIGLGGLFHVEGRETGSDTGRQMFQSSNSRITLLENHLLYGSADWTTFHKGEINSIGRLEVYPLPPQANPTTNPATSPTSPSNQ